jgi:hypothetical protein
MIYLINGGQQRINAHDSRQGYTMTGIAGIDKEFI